MPNDTHSITDLPGVTGGQPDTLFQDGDMALVLGSDMTIRTMTFGLNTEALDAATTSGELTEEQVQILHRGSILYALMIAAQSPVLMEIIQSVANDPQVIDFEKILAAATEAAERRRN